MRHGESLCLLLLFLFSLSACHYPKPDWTDESLTEDVRDSLKYLYERHYTWNTNLLVRADSVDLETWPVKGRYDRLYKGMQVVVAEFAIHPADKCRQRVGEIGPFGAGARLDTRMRPDA